MSLRKTLEMAERIVDGADEKTLLRLNEVVQDICNAETALLKKAGGLMKRCISGCTGICCKNVEIDLVIGVWDFVFVLLAAPETRAVMRECVKKEDPLFSADCVFLKNGSGPCLLPYDKRPEVCVVTFCDDTAIIGPEIGKVKRLFMKLGWVHKINRMKFHLFRLRK